MQAEIIKILILGEGCTYFKRHSQDRIVYKIKNPIYPTDKDIPYLTNIIIIKTVFQSPLREEYE